MSALIVIVFDNAEEAGKVRKVIREDQKQDLIELDDSAVIVKDANGKIHVDNELDRGVKVGAVAGGILGVLLGGLFFPLAGLVIGAAGGAGVGALTDLGIQKSFVKEVSESIQPDNSALFLLVRSANRNAVLASLKPYKGEVYHTSLSTEDEENLRRVLKDRE